MSPIHNRGINTSPPWFVPQANKRKDGLVEARTNLSDLLRSAEDQDTAAAVGQGVDVMG